MSRFTLGILLLASALGIPVARAATPASDRTTFKDSFREVAASSAEAGGPRVSRTVLTSKETAASMNFEVALRMRNFDEMQARIARGELISDTEKAARYFPLAADHDRVIAWLTAQGLEISRTDANHLAVFGRGSVDSVARVFQVNFARVVATDGVETTSAVTAPSVPAAVSDVVLGIHGLQPHLRRHPISIPHPVQPNTQVNLSGYTPAQIAAAYGATGIGTTGAGQTIAIYALGFPKTSDLSSFWIGAGVTQTVSNVTMVSIAGGPESAPAEDILQEVTLDTEWAGALAPGAAIRIYAANDMDPSGGDEILQQVYADIPSNPTMHVFSISIGGNELDFPKDYLIIESQYMANLASSGVTVLVASGDSGNSPESKVQTTFPTSDPDVTGVGGTTLVLNPNNTIGTESGWSDSGGGVSTVFSRPSWQTGTGVPSGTMRLVPDVASAADPGDGAMVTYNGNNTVIGGTSWSAPTWAAFCALINQKIGAPLGLLNPRIYPIAGSAAFRDITLGNNGFSTGVGYDLVTGLGVPNVTALAAAVTAASTGVNVPSQTGNQVVTLGQLATFFVVGEGAAPLTYQWQRMQAGTTSWVPLSDSGNYSGTHTPMMVVSGTTTSMSGDQFECIVANGGGSATSASVSLTVNVVGVTTLAGWPGDAGHVDGVGRAARFSYAGGVRTDPSGMIYASDSGSFTIRKITPAGVVTTVGGVPGVSGTTDGPVATALFGGVGGVAPDGAGNIYVADSSNYTIREISAAGVVSTLAGLGGTRGAVDGTGSQARLFDPQNLALDNFGNIYVADGKGNVIRKVSLAGVVTTIAGSGTAGSANGTGTAAQFNFPTGIAVDALGNVYIADNGNNLVRKMTPAGVVTTLAGAAGRSGSTDGSGSAATFNASAGLGVDSSGNVYVADSGNNTIRKIDPTGFVSTVAGAAGAVGGTDGSSSNARFFAPSDIAVDNSGIVYVADGENDAIRRIIPGLDSAPFFTAEPANLTVPAGATATFTAGISGTAPFTFQWSFDGSPIPGATTPYYTVVGAQQANVGSYSVVVSNLDGSTGSTAATLTLGAALPAAPAIAAQPVGGSVVGGSLTLSVTASGGGPFTYQWLLNGSAITGATASSYTATASGSYTVLVTGPGGSTLSSAAVVGSLARLINISSRAIVDTGPGITIAGFVISGAPNVLKQVLIRGVGPTLSAFSISGVLAAPTITLLNATGGIVGTNTGWGTNSNAAQIAALTAQVGAFALPSGSLDSALLVNLSPGSYTVQLSGVASTTGVGLIEVYEANTADASQLVNISTRAQVGVGSQVLIAGFVVQGSGPAKVLIRGVGPTLGTFGVGGTLALPVLTVFDSTNTQIAENTGWETGSNPTAVSAAETQLGAFTLLFGDSALVLTLNPGTYTAQVSGAGGSTGIALVEVYQLP